MYKWLEFEKTQRDKGKKTDFFYVNNKATNVTVGAIRWYGGFRKYVFEPNANTIFDASCLADIALFLNALMDERKIIKPYSSNRCTNGLLCKCRKCMPITLPT
jgi:hypothetical protein